MLKYILSLLLLSSTAFAGNPGVIVSGTATAGHMATFVNNWTIQDGGALSPMVYPGAGIANSTGSAWGTSYSVVGTGDVVLSASPTLTGTPNINGTLNLNGQNGIWDDNTNFNLSIGSSSMSSTVSQVGGGFNGQYNLGIGLGTLTAVGTGGFNVATGVVSQQNTTTGIDNSSYGAISLWKNTTGSSNNSFGESSSAFNTTGSLNDVFGAYAMEYNVDGSHNDFHGYLSGQNILHANDNSGYGYQSITGVANSVGNYTETGNSGFGAYALYSAQTSSYNSAFGDSALYTVTIGTSNIGIGYGAGGTTLTTGHNDLLFGNGVDTPTSSTSNFMNLGNAIYATGLSYGGGSTANGANVGIGTNTPGALFTVGNNLFEVNSSGVITGVGTNITGIAASLTAGNVTTNANSTGDVTSVGNATTVAKIQGVAVGTPTGTGNVVMSASPTLTGTVSGAAATWSGNDTAAALISTGTAIPGGESVTDSTANVAIELNANGVKSASFDKNGVPRFLGDGYVSADQSVSNANTGTTLQNITGLSTTLTAGKAYWFKLVLYTVEGSVGGVKLDLGGGNATATTLLADGYLTGNSFTINSLDPFSSLTTLYIATAGATLTSMSTIVEGFILVNGGGTFIPRFAQNAANATNTTIKTGSHIEFRQLN